MKYKNIGWGILITIIVLTVVTIGWMISTGGGWRFSAVQTASMAPKISAGTLVVVRENTSSQLMPGMIGMYQTYQGETVLHRLQAIMPNGEYVFRGDANPASDVAVNKKQVIGKLAYTVPYLGGVATFMKSWFGIVLCIYIPAVLVIAYEVNGLARRLSQAGDKSLRRPVRRT